MDFNILFLLVFIFVGMLFLYLEIRGHVRQKQYLEQLEPIMYQWRDNYDLTDAEKSMLQQLIKFSFNPLSVFKMVFYIWILPFKQGKKSEILEQLKARDKDLFKQTILILRRAFISASPMLHFIIWIESLILLLIATIILSILIILINYIHLKDVWVDKGTQLKAYRKRIERPVSLEKAIMQKAC